MIRHTYQRASAFTLDLFSFVYMNLAHGRTAVAEEKIRSFNAYLERCESLTRETFFATPPPPFALNGTEPSITWQSPVDSGFPENNAVKVELYWSGRGPDAPTVLFLHALMSASNGGYRRWAGRFNERGWNACFIHLPYHYSRKPKGYWNGQLAISPDLERTGEGLRMGVVEIRQLLAALRTLGCRDFGMWGSSYGGWITSLVASVEKDFRFIGLLEPITHLEHAIFESRACRAIRVQLRRAGIGPEHLRRHFHLSSPLSAPLLTSSDRVLLAAGTFDDVAPPAKVRAFHERLPGSEYVEFPQGHVGFELMEGAWKWLERRGLF